MSIQAPKSPQYEETLETVRSKVADAIGVLTVGLDGDYALFVSEDEERFTERERDEIHRALLRSGAHYGGKPTNPIEALMSGGEPPEPRLDVGDERTTREEVVEFIESRSFLTVVVIADEDEMEWDGEGHASYGGGRLAEYQDPEKAEAVKQGMLDFCTP